jgi:hypothetical protein
MASEVRQTSLPRQHEGVTADTKEESEQPGKVVQDLNPSAASCSGHSSAQVRRKPAHREHALIMIACVHSAACRKGEMCMLMCA